MKKISYVIVLIAAIALIVSAQLNWTEDSSNPIFGQGFNDGPKAYYPSVLYDVDEFSGHGVNAKYKMWYGTSGGQTGLATSDDGINWDEYGVVMFDGYHATVEYFEAGFTGVNSGENASDASMFYRMWYWDVGSLYNVSAIGYAESPDGVDWYNLQPCINGTVPIVSGVASWNRGSYGPSDILYNPGTDWVFTMYYDGTTGGTESIGLGFSNDGITWTGYDADNDGNADPVLSGTSVGEWDYNYVSRATIIKNADDDYEMWYSGGIGAMNHGIGYATSSDGITWTRDPIPIFHKTDGGADWRNSRTYTPMVIKDGCSYKMWFTGKDMAEGDYSIGYATASGECVIDVNIDIKPDSDPNSINLGSKGNVPVAIFSTPDFDATTIDPTTVTLAGASVKLKGKGTPMASFEDVNGDTLLDIIVHIDTTALEGLSMGDMDVVLNGETYDDKKISGVDTVRIVRE